MILDERVEAERRRIQSAIELKHRIGANLKQIRAGSSLLQKDVAAAMRDLVGTSWTKHTVCQVELGHRPLAAFELVALGKVFGVDICRFVLPVDGSSVDGAA